MGKKGELSMETQELLHQLEDYLIRIGLSNIPNARREREARKALLVRLLREARGQLSRLPAIIEEKATRGGEDPQALQDLRGFLDTLLPAELPPEARARPEEASPGWIGRVAPTTGEPATAEGFPFWIEAGIPLSLGDVITAEDPEGVRIVGVVQRLQSFTTLERISDHFMVCDMGRPESELPTEIPVIRAGWAGVLWRSDGRAAPPARDGRLRRATPEEIRRALAGHVDPDYAVPAGFLPALDEQGRAVWVPVDMDLRWIAGYEGGHINVAGISGVAAKTSYGLFLVSGLLAASFRPRVWREGGIAVIAFNVKEVDLMFLDRRGGWEEAPAAFQEDIAMWRAFREGFWDGLGDRGSSLWDPSACFQTGEDGRLPGRGQPGMRLFAPGHGRILASLRRDEKVEAFAFGWAELKDDPVAFYALFDPEDLDDKMIGAIDALLSSSTSTWSGMREELTNILIGSTGDEETDEDRRKRRRDGEWVVWNGRVIHRATLNKLNSRLRVIEESLGLMLERNQPSGGGLPIDALQPGHLWVIDITQLGDRARRYLFFRLLREIRRRLEERKAGKLDPEKFPGRVVMMVDELNRLAPSGGGRHPVREQLAAIAAQGRSIGLTLIGLQQMASRVDEEILINTATLAVGRSHPSELQGAAYAWLRPYREQVMNIPTGTMLVAHPLWRQPILVRFPRPLHRLGEEAERARKAREAQPALP